MIVVPAVDLLDGKSVRLWQGRYDEVTVYDDNPTVRARAWSGVAALLHVVDLEGARIGEPVQQDLIKRMIQAFKGDVQVGGGIRSQGAVEGCFSLGASRVVLGTAAAQNPEFLRGVALAFPKRIVVALDAKDGKVATHGWTQLTELSAVDLAKEWSDLPLAGVLYTDISRDGTEVGPNFQAIRALAKEALVPIIASGGVGAIEHIRALKETGAHSVIIGRALYENRFSLEDAIEAAAGH